MAAYFTINRHSNNLIKYLPWRSSLAVIGEMRDLVTKDNIGMEFCTLDDRCHGVHLTIIVYIIYIQLYCTYNMS